MRTFQDFEVIIKRKRHEQVQKNYHSTLCTAPDCYRNCHLHCQLPFSLDPSQLAACTAMKSRGTKCQICGHPRDTHRHFNVVWKEVEEDERVVDKEAEMKFNAAKDEKERKESMKETAQTAINALTREVDEATVQLGELAERYANLSLSGSFTGQIEKSIKLMEMNLKKMREEMADTKVIEASEKSVTKMKEKVEVLKEAGRKARNKGNFKRMTDIGKGFSRKIVTWGRRDGF